MEGFIDCYSSWHRGRIRMHIFEFTYKKENLGGTTGTPEDKIQVFNKPKFAKDLIKKISKGEKKCSACATTTEIREKDGQKSRIRMMVYNGSLTKFI